MLGLVGASLVTVLVAGEVSPREKELLVSSCNTGLVTDVCVADEGASPLVAKVRFDGDTLTVELTATDGAISTRELHFAPEDGTDQRAVAAGLLVAALAASSSKSSETPPQKMPEPLPPPPVTATPVAPPARGRARFGAALEGVYVGVDSLVVPKFGVGLRPFWLHSSGLWGAEVSGRYLRGTENAVSAEEFEVAAHLLFRLSGERNWDWLVRVGPLFDYSLVSAQDGTKTEQRELFRAGAVLGATVGYRLGRFSPYVSGEISGAAPTLTITLSGQELRKDAWISAGLAIGLRFDFLP